LKLNKEGLTFEEWVCAAEVASIDDGSFGVRPDCISYKSVTQDKGYQILNGIIEKKLKLTRRTTYFYNRKIRMAWINGEDPSEYRLGVLNVS
jgi:hypothetical protein